MHARVVHGVGKGEKCPQLRSVLIEGFHCTYIHVYTCMHKLKVEHR